MARSVRDAGNEEVLYMYGITQGNAYPVKTQGKIHGVDGKAGVDNIECGGLVCWVSRVPKSEFADDLARNMENLDWLAAMSTRHQESVAAITQVADVLPARFGTVFLNESSLRADIQNRQAELFADLKRIRGCEEWGVKVFAGKAAEVNLPKTLKTGKDYLKAKSAILESRKRQGPDEEIRSFARTLEEVSETASEGGRISGGRRDLLFQVSLLLKRANREKFAAIVKRFSKRWKDTRKIECTGPWPPYSFVSRDVQ